MITTEKRNSQTDSYLRHGVVVDLDDPVQVLDDDRGDVLELLEVKHSVGGHVSVECNRRQVTDGNLSHNITSLWTIVTT